MIITIDGPSASGKSTISNLVAQELGFNVLHTGLIYRAMAKKIFLSSGEKIFLNNEIEPIIKIAQEVTYLDLFDTDLDTEKFGMLASKIAIISEIRELSNILQKKFASSHANIVVEGRDAGTIVFPFAEKKFFIHVNIEIRAQRRFNELQGKIGSAIYNDVFDDMRKRDFQDSTRSVAPLIAAQDAIIIDNSTRAIQETVNEIIYNINKNNK